MKLWQKKYQLNKQIEKFTVGDDYLLDQNLVKYDCKGSIAHAKMLMKIGILTKEECNQIAVTLNNIIKENNKGSFIIKQQDEDCHTAIENYLIKKLGFTGKKIHTGRSRNDQILTALRLYYKDEIRTIIKETQSFVQVFQLFKEKYGKIKLPGYTHMQKAMPSSINLWTDAFIESMKDNILLLGSILKLIDQSPLGTGAGYGVSIKINRKMIANLLGFKKVQKNPIYVQNSRGKFESSILHGLSQIMFDLNKLASDILLFNMAEFGFFNLPDEICTGSSIMPHKKNPDALELVRAKYHQIVAYEFEIKNIIGNLISGYNRDLQLTKKPVIDSFDITINSLQIMKIILEKISVNKEKCNIAMTKELYSNEKTCKMVEKGMAFRDAYNQVADSNYFIK